jgi:hypothetical protein
MLLASQDAEGSLRVLVFDATKLPATYMVRPAPGEALPRNQAAELQKLSDLKDLAVQSGAVARDPDAWVSWYDRSLEAGQALELPGSDLREKQKQKAAVENQMMQRLGAPVPVAAYDDHTLHVQEHEEAQITLDEALQFGDQHATVVWDAIEQHKQMHAQEAQQAAVQASMQAVVQPGPPGAPPPGGAPQPSNPPLPAPIQGVNPDGS